MRKVASVVDRQARAQRVSGAGLVGPARSPAASPALREARVRAGGVPGAVRVPGSGLQIRSLFSGLRCSTPIPGVSAPPLPPPARPSRPSAATLREAAAVALGGLDCDAAEAAAESWRGRAWVAPQAADLHEWITACVQAWAEGRVSAAVLLVPVQPDADWWALLAGSPLCLLRQPETDQRRLGGRDRTSGAVIGLGVPAADLEHAFAGAGWTYQSSA